MRHLIVLCLLVASGISCSTRQFTNNGERIYRKGRNLNDEKLLDRKASRITIFNSCSSCHGKNGDAMRGVSIRWRDLSDLKKHKVPYDEKLFNRFLDHDLKSDGSKANIGVIWKMDAQDKSDLLAYLKNL